jgi:multicomponent Na+:H+ antiporter subunit G
MTEILVSVLLLTGGLFMLLAAVGIVRMPDLYMRIGTSTKASTLGLTCILTAVAVHFAEMAMSTRAIAAVVFVFLTAPIAAHMIGRAAYVVGVPLWERTIVDELRGRDDAGEEESHGGRPS